MDSLTTTIIYNIMMTANNINHFIYNSDFNGYLFEKQLDKEYIYYLEKNNIIVGYIRIYRDDIPHVTSISRLQIQIVLLPLFRNKGYGYEAMFKLISITLSNDSAEQLIVIKNNNSKGLNMCRKLQLSKLIKPWTYLYDRKLFSIYYVVNKAYK